MTCCICHKPIKKQDKSVPVIRSLQTKKDKTMKFCCLDCDDKLMEQVYYEQEEESLRYEDW